MLYNKDKLYITKCGRGWGVTEIKTTVYSGYLKIAKGDEILKNQIL